MTTTHKDIINYIAHEPEFNKICSTYSKNKTEADDLYQEFILSILEYKNIPKLIQVYDKGHIIYYCISIIKTMAVSIHAPHYKLYNDYSRRAYDIPKQSLNGNNIVDNFMHKSTNDKIRESILDFDTMYKVGLESNESNTENLQDVFSNTISNLNKINTRLTKLVDKDPLFFYNKQLFEMYYYENIPLRKIEELTKIDHCSIFKSLKKTLNLLSKIRLKPL